MINLTEYMNIRVDRSSSIICVNRLLFTEKGQNVKRSTLNEDEIRICQFHYYYILLFNKSLIAS
jgi:hypothetical protein